MIKEQLNLNLIDDDKESLLTVEPKRSWDGGSHDNDQAAWHFNSRLIKLFCMSEVQKSRVEPRINFVPAMTSPTGHCRDFLR